jgi:hypothetical protein
MAVFQPEQTAMSLSDLPSTTSIPRNNIGKILLPANFVPTEFTVICGRGKARTTSIGNRRLKYIINSFLKPYSEAKNRLEKSDIVSSIVGAIKRGGGNFVKCEDGIWWEVDDAYAKEKVGCLFRDYLHAQYRSSTKAKLAKRNARKTVAQESTLYLRNCVTYLHQGTYTSNDSQSSMLKYASTAERIHRLLNDASSTAEGFYRPCPIPNLSYQPMMQGTIGQDAYMMPVKSTTSCVQGSSYHQQQPFKGTSEYCSSFSNYIEQQRNRYHRIHSTDPGDCWKANDVRSGTSLQLLLRSHRNRY